MSKWLIADHHVRAANPLIGFHTQLDLLLLNVASTLSIMAPASFSIGFELARSIVSSWLNAEFAGGGSSAQVDKISYYEQSTCGK